MRHNRGDFMPPLSPFPIETVLTILEQTYPYHPMADVTEQDPFKVLVCCLLSIRSPDTVTMPACVRLFLVADSPEKLLALPDESFAALIEPVQYYRNKVGIVKSVCRELLSHFDGKVPTTLKELLSLKGVGRKTANLVLSLGYHQPAISVDTHVHRICNRLGYVKTRTPEETELALRAKLPQAYWSTINRVMVRHGQDICVAGRPKCDICPVYAECQRVHVIPRIPPPAESRKMPPPRNTPASWGIG
jgi:endonuclease III